MLLLTADSNHFESYHIKSTSLQNLLQQFYRKRTIFVAISFSFKEHVLHNFEAAVDAAIDEMPEDFVIRAFLLANRAGVKAMFLTEYDKEREFELLRREERREAKKELRQEVQKEVEIEFSERIAKDMLREKLPLETIKRVSKLSETAIRKLAKSIGVAVL